MISATLARKVSKRAPESLENDNSHPIDTIPEVRDAEYALEMLMMDGSWQVRRVVWTKDLIAFARLDQVILVDKIPLTDVTLVRDMSHESNEEATNKRKSSIARRFSKFSQSGFLAHTQSNRDGNHSPKKHDETSDLIHDGQKDLDNVQCQRKLSNRLHEGVDSTSTNFLSSDTMSAALEGKGYVNTVQLQTIPDGFNSGRTYYLRASNDTICQTIVNDLAVLVQKAKKRAQARTHFMRIQQKVRSVYSSFPFQCMVGIFIVANFVSNIVDVQIERESPHHVTLSKLDVFFTCAFTTELIINLFAHWLVPFLVNGWNLFDTVVITLSLVALGPVNLPVSVLRLVRAFRVIRLFGRMRELKKILSALSASIIPELNSFMIMFIVISIYCILGVTFFGEIAPANFGAFDLAFFSLFRVAVGETWLGDSLPAMRADGSANVGPILFFVSFVLVVNWTLLQACVAIMINNFISAAAQAQMDEDLKIRSEEKSRQVIRNSLDPLLERLMKDYTDERDLSSRLLSLFKVLDTNDSDSVSCDELCVGIKKLNFKPRIHVTESDFMILTRNGARCDSAGTLCFKEFEICMRDQIRFYAQRKLTESLLHETFSGAELAQIAAIKVILHEVLLMSDKHPVTSISEGGQQSENCRNMFTMQSELLAEVQALREEVKAVLHGNTLSRRPIPVNVSEITATGPLSLQESSGLSSGVNGFSVFKPKDVVNNCQISAASVLPRQRKLHAQRMQSESWMQQTTVAESAGSQITTTATVHGSDTKSDPPVSSKNSTQVLEAVVAVKMFQNGGLGKHLAVQDQVTETGANPITESPSFKIMEGFAEISSVQSNSPLCDDALPAPFSISACADSNVSFYTLELDAQRAELLKDPGTKFDVGVSEGSLSIQELERLQLRQETNALTSDPVESRFLSIPKHINSDVSKPVSQDSSFARNNLPFTVQSTLGIDGLNSQIV